MHQYPNHYDLSDAYRTEDSLSYNLSPDAEMEIDQGQLRERWPTQAKLDALHDFPEFHADRAFDEDERITEGE